jgi:hypothetical protein
MPLTGAGRASSAKAAGATIRKAATSASRMEWRFILFPRSMVVP